MYIEIGYTQKTHGVKGELKFTVEEPFWETFEEKKRVFLDIKGAKVPFFVSHVRGAFEDILQFEDVTTREAAYLLQSRTMYLLRADLPDDFTEEATSDLQYAYLAGYALIDQTLGPIGTIEEVLDMPQQEMAMLRWQEKDVLVPLHQSMIVRIDQAKKEILMDLPEGLLSI